MRIRRLLFSLFFLAVSGGALWFYYGPYTAGKSIQISEVCIRNRSVKADPKGEYTPYAELYNPSAFSVDLTDYSLSNDSFTVRLPECTLPPGGFCFFFLNGYPGEGQLPLRVNPGDMLNLKDNFGHFLCNMLLEDTPDDMSIGSPGRGRGPGESILMPPTPGEANICVEAPRFSVKPGYYDEEFSLELSSFGKDIRIYYTLDGSEPTEESILYEGPIQIGDATPNPNVYSADEQVSAGFLTEEIMKYSVEEHWIPEYRAPDFPVPKCSVVRAAAFDREGHRSMVAEGSYFVGEHTADSPEDFYVISLITDPVGLFDYDEGIYTLGRDYEEYKENSGLGPIWLWWTANYSRRGREWEREATLQLFRNHELVTSFPTGIRLKGQGSRCYSQKGFNLFPRREYGSYERASLPVFSADRTPDKFSILTGADCETREDKLKDYMVQKLAAGLDVGTQEFYPATMFIDGEYWGVLYLTEGYHKDFMKAHYGVSEENVIIVKADIDRVEEGTEEDIRLFPELLEFVQTSDMSLPENYEKFLSLVDIDSFVQYYAVQTYLARQGDWPSANWAAWRTRERENAPEGDTRWRWLLFDENSTGIESANTDHDSVFHLMGNDRFFPFLIRNEEFKARYVSALMDMGNIVFRPDRTDAFIDEFLKTMEEPMELHMKRFYTENKQLSHFTDTVEDIRSFFRGRQQGIEESLRSTLDLNGSVEELRILADPEACRLYVDGIPAEPGSEGYCGRYFTGLPVHIRVVPKEGYRFAGWEEGYEEEPEISVTLTEGEGVRLHAMFEETGDILPQEEFLTASSGEEAEIDLSLQEGNLFLTEPGTYYLRGELQGSVILEGEEDDMFRLVLDGVRIEAAHGPAIYAKSAGSLRLILEDGSENTLRGAEEYWDTEEGHAALFAACDLTIEGAGSLTVRAPVYDGIRTKDSLRMRDLMLDLEAARDGIRGNNGILGENCYLSVNAGMNGMLSASLQDILLKDCEGEISAGTYGIWSGGALFRENTNLLFSSEGEEILTGSSGCR